MGGLPGKSAVVVVSAGGVGVGVGGERALGSPRRWLHGSAASGGGGGDDVSSEGADRWVGACQIVGRAPCVGSLLFFLFFFFLFSLFVSVWSFGWEEAELKKKSEFFN